MSAFDGWLRRELSRMYDATLRQPIPGEWLDVLSMPPRPGRDDGSAPTCSR